MKFGIHNPSWLFGTEPAGIFDAVKAKAQWAENHGFTWFSVMDHLIQIANVGAPEEPFMEGWTILTALAAVTERIRLATLVSSVHYRNPALLAKMAAGVDQISRGRLTFGIGAGWFEAEYKQYGWDFPPKPATRIAQMEEAIKLILSMWTEKRTTFHGKYFHAENAILEPKPVQNGIDARGDFVAALTLESFEIVRILVEHLRRHRFAEATDLGRLLTE